MRRVRPLLFACLALLAVPASAGAHDASDPADAAVPHGDTPQEVQLDLADAVAQGEDAEALNELPTTWCGATPTAADNTTDAAFPVGLPQFRLVYAYPSDRPNRFAQWKDHLQANVSLITRFVAQQSGGLKAPRFDLGTSCGPGYADIAVVALPGPRSSYVDNSAAVRNAVNAAIGSAGGMRTPVIMGDQLSSGGLWGVGSLWLDDSPGLPNAHNSLPTSSVIWVPNAQTPPASTANGYWPSGFLHEMTHNMGGVQWGSPNNSNPGVSGAFHCWDGYDVMCYADSSGMPHPYVTTECGLVSGVINQIYDCHGDDYFNPAPTPGSWLASHWNVYDSVFLGDCATLGDACGREDGVPSAVVGPSVAGSGTVGVALTGSAGTWNGSPALDLQWQRDAGSGWQDIAGETGTTYTPVDADAGSFVRLSVTATNASGAVTANSAPVLVSQRVPPAVLAAPAVSGAASVGATLYGWPGSWSGAVGYALRWEREAAGGGSWSPITGATSLSHTIGSGDAGRRLRLRVTATNADGSTASVSAPTAVVTTPAPPADPVVPGVEPSELVDEQVFTPPTATPAPIDRLRSVSLRKGRRVMGKVVLRVTGSRATLQTARLRVPSGTYRVRVCGVSCTTSRPVARRGVLRLRTLSVTATGARTLRVTLKGPRWSAAGSVAP